jgi:hypothetical protein
MSLESTIEHIKKPFYLSMVILLYIAYIVTFFGIFYINPQYVVYLSYAIRVFVCLFLIYKFHPFRQHRLEKFDGTIIFASAFLLLSNMGMSEYVISQLNSNGTFGSELLYIS